MPRRRATLFPPSGCFKMSERRSLGENVSGGRKPVAWLNSLIPKNRDFLERDIVERVWCGRGWRRYGSGGARTHRGGVGAFAGSSQPKVRLSGFAGGGVQPSRCRTGFSQGSFRRHAGRSAGG